jgi:hypothetical protein
VKVRVIARREHDDEPILRRGLYRLPIHRGLSC